MALRPFSGSTPACAARPLTVMSRSTLPLRERHDVAVGARALEDEAGVRIDGEATDVRVDAGEPISSSGLATNTRRAERQPAAATSRTAASA